jgi:error-prone DNA polymerase
LEQNANMAYVELQCATHFSFLRACSSPDELFFQAKALGIEALAITDHNTLAGMVRAHVAAQATGVRLIIGCWLELRDGTSLLVYPIDRAGYGRLCRLLSLGKKRAGKGRCDLGVGRHGGFPCRPDRGLHPPSAG